MRDCREEYGSANSLTSASFNTGQHKPSDAVSLQRSRSRIGHPPPAISVADTIITHRQPYLGAMNFGKPARRSSGRRRARTKSDLKLIADNGLGRLRRVAFLTWIPNVCAAISTSLNSVPLAGLSGLMSIAVTRAFGINSAAIQPASLRAPDETHTSDIATRAIETSHNPGRDGVRTTTEDDRYGCSCCLRGLRRDDAGSRNGDDLLFYQFGRKGWEPIVVAIGPTVRNGECMLQTTGLDLDRLFLLAYDSACCNAQQLDLQACIGARATGVAAHGVINQIRAFLADPRSVGCRSSPPSTARLRFRRYSLNSSVMSER
jgi:hypothetical protein